MNCGFCNCLYPPWGWFFLLSALLAPLNACPVEFRSADPLRGIPQGGPIEAGLAESKKQLNLCALLALLDILVIL